MSDGLQDLTAKIRIDSSALDTTKEKVHGFGETFRGVLEAAGVAELGEKIFDFGKESVQAFNEAQAANDALQQSLSKNPKLVGANVQEYDDLAEKLSTVTEFSKTSIESGEAQLAQYKLNGDQLKQLTPLVADYAQRTGVDMKTAADNVGKAILGHGRAMQELGVKFTDLKDPTKNFNEVMDDLRGTVGGFAEKEGQTAQGKLAILGNQFEEIKVKVGSFLVPALSAAGDILINNVMPAVSQAADAIGKVLAPAFAIIESAVDTFMSDMQGGSDVFSAVGDAIASFAYDLGLGTGGVSSFLGIWSSVGDVIGGVVDELSGDFKQFFGFFKAELPAIGKAIAPFAELFMKAIGQVVSVVVKDMPQIRQIISQTFQVIEAVIKDAVAVINFVWNNFGHQITAVVMTSWKVAADVIGTAINVIKDVVSVVLDLLQGKWGAAWNGMKNLVGDVFKGIGSIIGDTLAGVVAFFKDLPSHIAGAIGNLAGFLHDHVFQPVVDMITGVFSGVGGFVAKIGDSLKAVVLGFISGAINWFIDKINDFQIHIHVGPVGYDWDGFQLPHVDLGHVPNLAEGGVVPATPGGRLVRVAEAGRDEAITPLDKDPRTSGQGRGSTVNIYVNHPRATARDISREFGWHLRTA